MTINDTFNRADSTTTLGTTSDGSATWTAVAATWGISSNQAYISVHNLTGNARQLALIDAGSADVDVQVTFAALNGSLGAGLAFRAIDENNHFFLDASGRVCYFLAGSFTNLGTSVTGGFAAGDTAKVSLSGSTIKVYKNGVLQDTVTSTVLQTATKHGMSSDPNVTGTRFDDFSVGLPVAPTSLTGSVTVEHVLAGALGRVTLTAHIAAEHSLAATLTTTVTLTGSAKAEHVLAGTLTLKVRIAAWSTNDFERTDLPLELAAILDVEPVEDPPPTTDPYIQRVSVTMPTPTLVNGRPTSAWTATVSRSDWGRLQLVVAGVDRSRPRGKMFIPLNDASTEPFGDAEAAFAFPGLSEFDDPSVWGFTPLAPVTLRRKDPTGVFHTLYEGDVASIEPDTGQGLVVQCVGAIYRLDLLKEPPTLLAQAYDLGDLVPAAVNDKRRRYAVNIGYMRHVSTGIQGVGDAGAFKPFLSGFVQDHLALMGLDNGSQWTVAQARPRTPVLQIKDMTTVHATVSYAAPGVDVKISKDFTTATTAVYGTGSDGHCSWMGARFPNLTGGSVPAFPLTPGNVFDPGDGQSGFAPFAAFLRRGQYGQIESDDTYLGSDEDSVRQFQDRAGITVDGIVGAQTWEAAFQPGANQGSLAGAYVDTIYEKPQTRLRIYNAQGADVGPNSSFDPTVPRVEDYIPFGENVSKAVGTASAKQIISRDYPAGRSGTITLTTDPQERSRFELNAGMNIRVQNYAGASVLVHVTRRVRDWQSGAVTLTVDEKSHDNITSAVIRQRDKDVADLTRRPTHGRTRSRVFNDYGAWLCEDGAGHIPLMNQQGGFWNVQRVAAARKGTIERISLALGTGLTEHILNENLSSNPPATIPGAARGCILITSEPVSANAISALSGLGTPLTDMADGTNPWDHNADELTNRYGMVYAAGGPGAAIGFYPNDDPGDGSSTHLSGRFEDGGSVQFGPSSHYWLWVSIWTPVSCIVGGRIYPGAPD